LDPITANLLTDAIKILGPAIVTAVVAYRTAKTHFETERMKLFDKDRTEAYKRLLRFARKLKNQTFPLAERKRNAFEKIMKQDYFDAVELDSIYFGERPVAILDELESRYVCMTDPDLIPEMDPDDERKFLDEKLYGLAEELSKEVRAIARKRGISA
jgi:hypothetical protein